MVNRIYRLLEVPSIYRLANAVLAPGWSHLIGPLYQRVFGHSTGRVLDVGCGPGLKTPRPKGLLVGIDVNSSYIKDFTGGFLDQDAGLVCRPPAGRECLGYVASADQLPFPEDSFDEARTSLVFHHLPRVVAVRAVQEMVRCVRKGGRVILLDLVWPRKAWARPLAWLTLSLDRGRFMRSQEELLALTQEACPGSWNWERCTGTYTGMEYLCLQMEKK